MMSNDSVLADMLVESIEAKDVLQSLILLSKFDNVDHIKVTWNQHKTILRRCIELGLTILVEAIIPRSTNLNQKGLDSWTAVHVATVNSQSDILGLLLDNGADVHARTKNGNTALHFAAQSNLTECIEVLLKHGADPNALNAWGETAIRIKAKETFQFTGAM